MTSGALALAERCRTWPPRGHRARPERQLAQAINRHHAACRDADRAALTHAIRAGELLMDAKAALHHGEWGAWVAAHCTFAARTAQLYMQLARYAQANPQRVADLTLSEGIQVVRQAPEGPPYECRSPRLEWTLGFTCRIDYDRWVAFLRRHRSAGNPVPLLLRAAPMIQRMARLCCRVRLTCIGTWYVAPPTRFERTSTVGLTCSTAWVNTSMGLASGMRFLIWSSAP